MQKTRQVPGLSPGAARRRDDRRPLLAAPSLWAAPPRLPPKKRKGQEGPALAWPLPTLQADSHAPTPEFSMLQKSLRFRERGTALESHGVGLRGKLNPEIFQCVIFLHINDEMEDLRSPPAA